MADQDIRLAVRDWGVNSIAVDQLPRRFVLDRRKDISGISGTGVVARGVEFHDGAAVLRWCVGRKSTAIYDSMDDLVAIHGHDGSTQVRWID